MKLKILHQQIFEFPPLIWVRGPQS